MRPGRAGPLPVTSRTVFRSGLNSFLGLGFSSGVWAVQLSDLRAAAGLNVAQLGLALTLMSGTGLALSLLAIRHAESVPRRWLAICGPAAVGSLLLLSATVRNFPTLLAVFAFGGLCFTIYDIAVNTLGSDFERHFRSEAMTRLHAGFSAGGAIGALFAGLALSNGLTFQALDLCAGVLLLLWAVSAKVAPLAPAPSKPDPVDSAAATRGAADPSVKLRGSLMASGLPLAAVLIWMCSYIDGALEGFTSVYLRDVLDTGPLLVGVGVASFHTAALGGCLLGSRAVRVLGANRVLATAGVLIAAAITTIVTSGSPIPAIAGLLLIGASSAPSTAIAYSMAGRAGTGRGAGAIALVTTVAYSAFASAPLAVGGLSAFLPLRATLLTILLPSLGILAVSRRLRPAQIA